MTRLGLLLAALATVAALAGCAVVPPFPQVEPAVPVDATPSTRPGVPAREAVEEPARFRFLWLTGVDAPLAYCATVPIEKVPQRVTRVIVALAGLDDNACGWRGNVAAAIGDRDDTIVVAPQFGPSATPEGALRWTTSTWPTGAAATNGAVSSYAALDALIEPVADREVVLVGFSGGGQMTNRYAAISPTRAARYLVMNPSSYVYFTPDRPGAQAAALRSCPDYDDWRYGLGNRSGYPAQLGEAAVLERYRTRRVLYFIGDRDDNPRDGSLDRSCGAMAQGPNREVRALRYREHLRAVFGPGMDAWHPLTVVPGVAHSGTPMVRSAAARAALLGEG